MTTGQFRRSRGRSGQISGLLVLAMIVSLVAAPAPADSPAAIPFAAFREASRLGAERQQVTVVYFTADWCTWCQRMERVSFRDERVLRAAGAFQWAKVDADSEPYLMGAFGIRGVPAMAFLNAEGELLELSTGYLSPDALNALLEKHAGQAEAPGRLRRDLDQVTRTAQQLIDVDDEQVDAVVLEAVTMLAEREVIGHQVAHRSVLEMGQRAWPAVAAALNHERLAVRAAAYELLLEATGASLAFDPFADAQERQAMAMRWQDWTRQQLEAEPADETPASAAPVVDADAAPEQAGGD